MISELPYTLTINGAEYPINTDFRDALDALDAFNAKDLSPLNKQLAVREIIYRGNCDECERGEECAKECLPPDVGEALRQAAWFLDGGDVVKSTTPPPQTMDYAQDAPLLFSAVNKVAGREVRDPKAEIHWWTFIGYCNEISPDSLISHIVHIRYKRAKNEKLEKHEQKFYNENRHLIDFSSGDDSYEEIMRQLRGE